MEIATIFYTVGIIWLLISGSLIIALLIIGWRLYQILTQTQQKIASIEVSSLLSNLLKPISGALLIRSVLRLFRGRR